MPGSKERVSLLEHNEIMQKYGSMSGDTLLNQKEASYYLRLKENTLMAWRSRPTKKTTLGYVTLGGSVFYELSALRKFVVEGRVVS